jgi:hypothetical protein
MADARITEFLASRVEAAAVQIVALYEANRIARQVVPDGEGGQKVEYRIRRQGGTFTAWHLTTYDALAELRSGPNGG